MAEDEEKEKAVSAEELKAITEKTEEEKSVIEKITAELQEYLDIPLTVSAELGRTKVNVKDILKMRSGQVIELHKLVGEPMEIFINGLLTARGEVVVVNERFGIRVTDVIDPMEIVRDD